MQYSLVTASCCHFDYVCLIKSTPGNKQECVLILVHSPIELNIMSSFMKEYNYCKLVQ